MRAAIAIAFLAACGEHETASPPAPPPAPAAPVDARARALAASPPDAHPPAGDSLDGLFTPGPVRPPGPLAALPLDVSLADAKRIAPAFFTGADVTSPRWPGVTFSATLVAEDSQSPIDELGGTAVGFPDGLNPRAAIERAWGPGIDAKDVAQDIVVWFNPDAGIRAKLVGDYLLEFERYLPLARMLGDGRDVAVGPTPDELRTRWPAPTHRKVAEAAPPPTEWDFSDGSMTVTKPARGGAHLSEYALRIPFGPGPHAREEILAAFRHKWGPGERRPHGTSFIVGEAIRFVSGPIEIDAQEYDYTWYLYVIDTAIAAKVASP